MSAAEHEALTLALVPVEQTGFPDWCDDCGECEDCQFLKALGTK